MKKQLLTIAGILFSFVSYGQNFKFDNDLKEYILDTVSISKLSKQQLYSNALNYLTNRFTDSRSVIESKDLELGEISFSGNTRKSIVLSDTTKKGKISSYNWNVGLAFKCKIFLKDQKFKISLYSLEKQPVAGTRGTQLNPFEERFFIKESKAAAQMALGILKDISEHLNKKPQNDF